MHTFSKFISLYVDKGSESGIFCQARVHWALEKHRIPAVLPQSGVLGICAQRTMATHQCRPNHRPAAPPGPLIPLERPVQGHRLSQEHFCFKPTGGVYFCLPLSPPSFLPSSSRCKRDLTRETQKSTTASGLG